MVNQLLIALVRSKNQAADDVLVQALRLGDAHEKTPILEAILYRKSVPSLCGVVGEFDRLPEPLQRHVLAEIKTFHPALREAGRSEDPELRLAALRLIALGRQGKLAYVLSENLHDSNPVLSKAATEAMVAMARWASIETRKLQRGVGACVAASEIPIDPDKEEPEPLAPIEHPPTPSSQVYAELIAQRPEIEAAVARALDVHRGKHGVDLLRAGLLLCDWPGSKTLAILHTAKHGGQSPMVRRLQQPPASENVEAFLLGASHGQLRSHFGLVFAQINEAPVLDALLRRVHWLADHQLQVCMHQVSRGAWWNAGELVRDIDRRTPEDAAKVGEWLAVSGSHDVVQDERMETILAHCGKSFDARLRLLRIAARRRRGSSVQLLRTMLGDGDERLMRMATREILRRKPLDYENMLLQLMTAAPPSVRKLASRAIGQSSFDNFWTRFDRLDRSTRRSAGRAMLKILPDAVQRLRRRLIAGPPEQRIKALQIAQELGLADELRDPIVDACSDEHPRLRSKAVIALGDLNPVPTETLIERMVTDSDPRVRANAIEVMETRPQDDLLQMLTQRALSTHNRERANAIKALHRMKVAASASQLITMLRDPRPEHRISALWTLRQIGWWQLLNEVGRVAKDDSNLKVRRYALSVLKNVAELAKSHPPKQKEAG